MKIPKARGPASAALFETLCMHPGTPSTVRLQQVVRLGIARTVDICHDEDLQLTLFCLYELHYLGIHAVDDGWEWDGPLLSVRAEIESALEAALRTSVSVPVLPAASGDKVATALLALTAETSGMSMSHYIATSATTSQLAEFLVHRSIYHLKEADPHSWLIPRLTGKTKAALIEIVADENGGSRPERTYARLFAGTMRAVGLSDQYGEYLDHVPGLTLTAMNMMSFFGLHRRLRGAMVGDLAVRELTASTAYRMYGNGFRRLGYGTNVTDYFDEHVADALQEQIAGCDLAGSRAEAEPDLLEDIFFGASVRLMINRSVDEGILSSWHAGVSSLREPLHGAGSHRNAGYLMHEHGVPTSAFRT